MVLDSTVMNVSISEVVSDLGTTVSALQAAITLYTLTMAAFMLFGGKLGDIWGRLKIFRIGIIIYGIGSLMTGLSQNITELTIGWSMIEGFGAVLVIPAIAALTAAHYQGRDRVKAYAVIGGISGAAAAAGPLIGGFVTTYFSWRDVFIAETVIMVAVLAVSTKLVDKMPRANERIDVLSVIGSSVGMAALVLGILQSKTWGWVTPKASPQINGHAIEPFGVSLVAYLILLSIVTLRWFYRRQQMLEREKRNPLLKTSLFSLKSLRAGLAVLGSQYAIIAGVFFALPVYLQMTLGYDALTTGVRILPLSVGVILFSVLGTRLSNTKTPRQIVRYGQWLLVTGSALLLASISPELKGWIFGFGLAVLGGGLGLLASQLGNVNMSAAPSEQSGEVGGLQGVFQNLGSSVGTALIGSVLIAALGSSFANNVQASTLPSGVKDEIQQKTAGNVAIIPAASVTQIATSQGLSTSEATELSQIYSDSQVSALRESLFAVFAIALISLLLSRNIPNKKVA